MRLGFDDICLNCHFLLLCGTGETLCLYNVLDKQFNLSHMLHLATSSVFFFQDSHSFKLTLVMLSKKHICLWLAKNRTALCTKKKSCKTINRSLCISLSHPDRLDV